MTMETGIILLFLVFVLTFVFQITVEARLLDSEELFIGEWRTKLCCSASFFDNVLFPSKQQQQHTILDDNNSGIIIGANKKNIHHRFHRWLWKSTNKSYDCILNVYPNGTFHIEPSTNESILRPTTINRLAINGKWKINANPYCATDRFYDQIVLQSNRRIQKKIIQSSSSLSSSKRNENIQQTIQSHHINMHCRLYGHHSNGRLTGRYAKAFARGKMTHGVIILNQHQVNKVSMTSTNNSVKRFGPFPRVVAGFRAERIIPSIYGATTQLDEQEKLLYGY